jgi:hypothetical protein
MKNANDHFGNSLGSENYFRHNPSQIIYTEGVKDLAEKCHAYWLIDLIISHQLIKKVKAERFQVWDLKRVKADKFTIITTDGNSNKVSSQNIPYSDFPYDIATLWLVDGTLLLPCEY